MLPRPFRNPLFHIQGGLTVACVKELEKNLVQRFSYRENLLCLPSLFEIKLSAAVVLRISSHPVYTRETSRCSLARVLDNGEPSRDFSRFFPPNPLPCRGYLM